MHPLPVFLAVHLWPLIWIRCSQSNIPIYARALSVAQDLFVYLELFVLGCLFGCLFPSAITAILGMLLQIYLLFDAFLYRRMQFRMRLRYLHHVKHLSSMRHSAQEMGIGIFLGAVSLVLTADLFAYSFLDWHPLFFPHAIWVALGGGLIAVSGLFLMPPKTAYIANNPLFEEQVEWIRSYFHSPKKSAIPPIRWNSLPSDLPRQFELRVNPAEKPNLIFIFLESFSAKSLVAAPQFRRWSEEGVFFPHFYSNGTLTYSALLSSLFGIPPGSTSRGLLPYLEFPFQGLPHLLKKEGYKTAFHHNGSLSYERFSDFLGKHFEEVVDRNALPNPDAMSWGVHDEHLFRFSSEWTEKQETPFFLSLLTVSNHHPWKVPNHYKSPSFGHPPHSPFERYLQTTHYTDWGLNEFLERLRSKNLSKKTILFIFGDHAQPMGEHRENFYNSRFLYEENVHIPFLILAEGRIASPKTIDDIGSQIDLMPTALDLLRLPGSCLGRSLMRKTEERIAPLQNGYSEGFRGLRKGRWKWIRNQLSRKNELYDLSRDPGEKDNLAELHPEVAESMKEESSLFYQQVDAIYQGKKDASSLENHILDLSKSPHLTDGQLTAFLSPLLQRIELPHCLLLTNSGVGSILSTCPHLEILDLKGVTDLTDELFHRHTIPQKLIELNLSDAHLLTDAGIEALAENFPRLQNLSLNGANLSGKGIEAIARRCKNLTRFALYGGERISENSWIALFKNNPHISRLILSDCPHLTDRTLQFLIGFPIEQLWLLNAGQITDEGIAALSQNPIRSLTLTGCRRLTEKCHPYLLKLNLESVYFNDSPALDPIQFKSTALFRSVFLKDETV